MDIKDANKPNSFNRQFINGSNIEIIDETVHQETAKAAKAAKAVRQPVAKPIAPTEAKIPRARKERTPQDKFNYVMYDFYEMKYDPLNVYPNGVDPIILEDNAVSVAKMEQWKETDVGKAYIESQRLKEEAKAEKAAKAAFNSSEAGKAAKAAKATAKAAAKEALEERKAAKAAAKAAGKNGKGGA